ncbi:MAG: hypothetical protein IJY91_01880, partial [Oscillospiraceae bacterium]|nr:hypothetical protein [Oscillospiraceae bacterium]
MRSNGKKWTVRLLCLLLTGILSVSMVPLCPLLANAAVETEAVTKTVPVSIDPSQKTSAYECTDPDHWIPMYPTGQPDNSSTWPEWDDTHYAQILYEGYKDIGALHMVSAVQKNTAVAIYAGLTAGTSYTLGLWVKGSTNNTNKVLALYGNGDGVLIGQPEYSPDGTVSSSAITEDWMYVEKTFTATGGQLNLLVPDWGNTELYIDNITLKRNSISKDLLSGKGDFYHTAEVPVTYEPVTLNPLKTSDAY